MKGVDLNNRDSYTRCKICKKLFATVDAIHDPIKGYLCPRNCEEPFEQPSYESPFNGDERA
jgi:hypothetical protein